MTKISERISSFFDKTMPHTPEEARQRRHIVAGALGVVTTLAAIGVFNRPTVNAEKPQVPSFSDKVITYAQHPDEDDTTISCPVEQGRGTIESAADCLNNTGIFIKKYTFDKQGNLSGGPGIDADTSLIVSGLRTQKAAEATGFLQPGYKIQVKLPTDLNDKYVTPVVIDIEK